MEWYFWRLVCCALRSALQPYYITPLMYELHWRPLKQRIHFKILLFAIKAIHGIAPAYTQNLVSLKSQGVYNLRSSGGILLALSTFRTKVTLGVRSFQVAAPKLWMLYRVSFAILQTWILLRAILSRTFLSLLTVEWIWLLQNDILDFYHGSVDLVIVLLIVYRFVGFFFMLLLLMQCASDHFYDYLPNMSN